MGKQKDTLIQLEKERQQLLEEVERTLLIRAIDQTQGDRGQMSKLLGVERNTLRYKLNKFGLLDK